MGSGLALRAPGMTVELITTPPASRLGALLLDELLLRELADGGAREGVADLERRRHLVPADLVGEEGAQRLERERRRARRCSLTNAFAASPR